MGSISTFTRSPIGRCSQSETGEASLGANRAGHPRDQRGPRHDFEGHRSLPERAWFQDSQRKSLRCPEREERPAARAGRKGALCLTILSFPRASSSGDCDAPSCCGCSPPARPIGAFGRSALEVRLPNKAPPVARGHPQTSSALSEGALLRPRTNSIQQATACLPQVPIATRQECQSSPAPARGTQPEPTSAA